METETKARWDELKKQLLTCPGYDLIGLKAKEEGEELFALLEIEKEHLNYAGIGLGGFTFAVGDAIMRWEVSRQMPDKKVVTGTAKIVYKKAAIKGILTGKARIINQEGRKVFTSATVLNEKGEIVAEMEGVFIIIE